MRTLVTFLAAIALMLGVARFTWAQVMPSMTGTVQQYLLNPYGEIDGVLLSDGTVVKFPPYLGIALATSVKAGDTVTVVGFFGPTTPQGRAVKALTITNTKTGQTLVDQPPPTPPLPPDTRGLPHTPLTVHGTVARFLVNPYGEFDGLILSGGEQIKFPPHQGTRVYGLLEHSNSSVTVAGLGTENTFGKVVKAEMLTVGNHTVSLGEKKKYHKKKK